MTPATTVPNNLLSFWMLGWFGGRRKEAIKHHGHDQLLFSRSCIIFSVSNLALRLQQAVCHTCLHWVHFIFHDPSLLARHGHFANCILLGTEDAVLSRCWVNKTIAPEPSSMGCYRNINPICRWWDWSFLLLLLLCSTGCWCLLRHSGCCLEHRSVRGAWWCPNSFHFRPVPVPENNEVHV